MMTITRLINRAFFLVVVFTVAVPAFGEELAPVDGPAVLVQQYHPVFYDLGGGPPPLDNLASVAVMADPESRRGGWGDWLVKYNIMRPKYDVYLQVDFSKLTPECQGNESVTWEFPRAYYFPSELASVTERKVKVDAWRSFAVAAKVKCGNDSEPQTFRRWVPIPPKND